MLVEAMAAGTPVVASELDAFSRVLDQGQAGRLVPVGDADGPGRRADRGARQRRRCASSTSTRPPSACARYDWSVVAGQIMRVYETVASPGIKVQAGD